VDTRTKIIGAERAAELAQAGAQVVSGYFDPLVASLAEQLIAQKRPGYPLLVLIRSSPNPILPARARAELVAALEVVDFVCDTDIGVEPDVRLDEEHERRLQELITHVHARQNAPPRNK
jgi:hypothetical protein